MTYLDAVPATAGRTDGPCDTATARVVFRCLVAFAGVRPAGGIGVVSWMARGVLSTGGSAVCSGGLAPPEVRRPAVGGGGS
jgi:hypothetical protein